MKAEEMFKKLGYTKEVCVDSIDFKIKGIVSKGVYFLLKSKKIIFETYDGWNERTQDFDIDSESLGLLNAIQKQVEELGW